MTPAERQAMWRERIGSFQASGMTQKAWCESEGVNLHRFHYWLKKFRREQTVSHPVIPAPSATFVETNQMTSTDWVTVEVADDRPSKEEPGNLLIHVGGVSVEVRSGFDKSLLTDLLGVLKGC